jgi:hypothetical protein
MVTDAETLASPPFGGGITAMLEVRREVVRDAHVGRRLLADVADDDLCT